MKIFNWFFSMLCILCLPAFGLHIGSLLLCILGIASLPIKPINDKWEKIPTHKILKPFITGFLFIIFAAMIPVNTAESDKSEQIAETSTQETMSNEQDNHEEEAPAEIPEPTQAESTESQSTPTEVVKEETEENTSEITESPTAQESIPQSSGLTFSLADIPSYAGNPYVAVNNNVPYFSDTDLTSSSYEYYSELDSLGRCGVAYACIGTDLIPNEERGNIGSVKPSGWHTIKYDCVDGKYLYNRCHLIGYQLSGENANESNLITGTRYMNVEGMLPFENMVADYVNETGNHVMYRVTPIFEGDNLIASGVLMEAKSVEDMGEGILFNVFCYNVQPDIEINYVTGESSYIGNETTEEIQDNNENAEESSSQTATEQSNITPEPDQTQDTGSTANVWKSATGDKYHSVNNCGRMNPDKATQLTESEAQAQGLEKCNKCW